MRRGAGDAAVSEALRESAQVGAPVEAVQQLLDALQDGRVVGVGPHEAELLVQGQHVRRARKTPALKAGEQLELAAWGIAAELGLQPFQFPQACRHARRHRVSLPMPWPSDMAARVQRRYRNAARRDAAGLSPRAARHDPTCRGRVARASTAPTPPFRSDWRLPPGSFSRVRPAQEATPHR